MTSLEEIRPKIKQLEAMPTIPAVIQPLTAMLQSPLENVDVDKVVELVSYDSTIAAQCLRMANSPLFGRRETASVRAAILALGLKRIQAILLGCCLNRIVSPEQWCFDPIIFWRHSLGCALVSRKMASLIGYPDPEKAYLAGLVHDLGFLVNTVVCHERFHQCIQSAQINHIALHCRERELLGFTHCQSGRLLAEQWKFPDDIISVIACHHDIAPSSSSPALVSLVHLSDLLCRLRDLGYGYYEAMGIDLAGDDSWAALIKHFPDLSKMDLARLTMDIDGSMDNIIAIVEAVFQPQPS